MGVSKSTALAVTAAAALLLGGGTLVAYHAGRAGAAPPPTVVAESPSPATAPAADPSEAETDPADWRTAFNRAYGLADGEVLRRVKPPFIPERQQFWDAELGGGRRHEEPLATEWLSISWNGVVAHWQTRSLAEETASNVVSTCTGLQSWHFELSPTLAQTKLPGDWVFRKGSTVARRMDALSAVLTDAVGHAVRFERRTLDRDTLVVTGQYAYAPLDGHSDDGAVHLIGRPNPQDQSEPRPHRSTVAELIEQVGSWANLPTIDETGDGRQSIRLAEQAIIYDTDTMVANVAKQTGLTFAHERRPTEVWVAVEAAAGR